MNTLLTGISTLLQSTFGATMKKYFIGDPKRILATDCPMIAIYPVATEQDDQWTGTVRDQNNFNIAIKLIDNARTYYGDANSETKNASLEQFITWMEKRDADGNYDTPSIMYTLRSHANFDLNGYGLFTDGFKIDYNDTAEQEDNNTISATLTFRAVARVNRNTN